MAEMTVEDELALIKGNTSPTPVDAPAMATSSQPMPQAARNEPTAQTAANPVVSAVSDPEADLPPAATDLPAPPEAANTWDVMSAAWKDATIRGDTWNYEGRQRNALAQTMFDLLSPEAQAEVRRSNYGIKPEGWFWKSVVEAAGKEAAANPDAASKFGDMPITPEAFDARIRANIIADRQEAKAVLDRPGGGLAEFLGESARVMTGPSNVAATILGAFTGGTGAVAWRVIASEALLNAGAEGIDATTETDVARKYGWEEPDVAQRMLFGAVLGGAFSGAVIGGAKLFGLYQARHASARAAVPEGADPLAAEAQIDAAEARLRDEPTAQELAADPDDQGTLGAIVSQQQAGPSFTAVQEAGPGYTVVIGPDGQAVRREGTRAWRNNNPGNIEFGPFARSMGAIGTDGRFAVFPTYEQGRAAKAALLWTSKGYRGKTIGQAIARYAPSFENDTGAYTRAITKALGVTADTPMAGLTRQQREMMMDAMERVEGFRPGTENGVQARAPRKGVAYMSDEAAPTFDSSRGYTGSGQVKVGDDMTIDVDYQVVDASTLSRASGPYQPRDRSRVNSDAWIADTAARLDPAQLMPSPTADRGAPIVGPDNMIESGNGRFGAILRTYERHPDRAEAYRGAIEAAGFAVPEGVDRPVLIARRRTELTDPQRVKMTVDAQDSGVAVMTPTEMAQVAARNLTPERLDRMDMRFDIAAPENEAFLRSYMETLPRSLRNAMSDAEGGMNGFGRKSLRDAIFARAWSDPDIIELMTEGQRGDLKGLFDALETSAPAWAALKADIEAGRVLPEMDISGYVLDAMRMIAAARRIAARDKQPLAKALDDLLNSPDMIEGAVSPLTAALLRKFWRNGRAAPEDEVASFLTRYAEDARKAGASAGLFDAPTPRDVLAAIDRATFGDLPEDLGTVRGFAKAQPVTPPPAAFAEGSASPDAQAADQATREALKTPAPSRFGPEFPEFNGDPEAAIAKLMTEQTGEVPEAITIEGLGPVRFIWGSKVLGLRHILDKHGEATLKDLPRAMREGQLGPEYNGRRDLVTQDTPNRRTVIRLDMDTTDKRAWVLTSHDVIQGTDAQPGRTSNGLTETTPPSVPGATAQADNTTMRPADQSAPDAIQAELAATRAEIAETATDLGDDFLSLPFEIEGIGRVTVRELLDDIDADAAHAAVLRACAITPTGGAS